MRPLLASLLLLPVLAACQPAAPTVDLAAEEEAILAQVVAFNAAVAAYDGAATAAVYATDAVILPPNQERQTGSAWFESMITGLEQLKGTFVVTPVAIVVAASGDLAVEEGTWKSTIPGADSTTFEDNGKYLVGWKKVNGTWLILFDTWNSDNAPPAASK